MRCILILILAIFIFRDNSYIASKVILIVLIYFTIKKYFVVYAIQLEKSEIKKLKRKASIQQNIYLYSWLGEGNLKNSFLFEVLREDKMEKSDILNLNKVKWYLKKRLGDNVGDYHLLKSFLEAQQKNNLAELAKSFIAPLVVGCFSIILRELVSSEKFKTFINDFFNITLNNNDTFSYISLMLDIFLIVMLVIYSVIFVLTVLNKDKKRIGTIIAVLDNIIYEKEKK
ncbi:hypothetical protein [Terribacillus aidingensis]|uniref:hypothetical protein n=1 Tax=Terribacillus aidingensis TaxID=586416 RepID=UPI0011816CDA|nr:hypothetical protein [Terribacillus aidingensis]